MKNPNDPNVEVDVLLSPSGINGLEHYLSLANPKHWFAQSRSRRLARIVKNTGLASPEAVDTRVSEYLKDPSRALRAESGGTFQGLMDLLTFRNQRMYLRAKRANDQGLTPQKRAESVRKLREIVTAPRARLESRLRGYEAVQKKSQDLVKNLIRENVRVVDPRYANAKSVADIANRIVLEQVQQREAANIGHTQATLWQHQPAASLPESTNDNWFWTRVADRIPELERAGFGRSNDTAAKRAENLKSWKGIKSALDRTPEQREIQ